MQSDKKLIGAGLIALALVLLIRKRQAQQNGLPSHSGNTGGLITAGISYCADCGA